MRFIDRFMKRSFDMSFAAVGLIVLAPVILTTWFLARRDTRASGFFVQERIGRHGRTFKLIKLRTMLPVHGSTVTTSRDARITPLGARFRRWKLDELPQLWNVLVGDMSLVGPRPDVSGFMDKLQGDDQVLLQLRPGITGPATLKYRDEEELLARVADPIAFNAEVIWPDKVHLNKLYLRNWSFLGDIACIIKTITR